MYRKKKWKICSDENIEYEASYNNIHFKITTYFDILDMIKSEQ